MRYGSIVVVTALAIACELVHKVTQGPRTRYTVVMRRDGATEIAEALVDAITCGGGRFYKARGGGRAM